MGISISRRGLSLRMIVAALLAALACGTTPSANAGEFIAADAEMVFAVVRASNPICEPKCPEWIAAEGEIRRNTASAFKAVLKKLGKRNLPLLISSSGGDNAAAMEIGKLIRKRQMIVEVARTDYLRCRPREKGCKPELKAGVHYGYANTIGAFCNSACTFVLAGGVRRLASPLSSVGIHSTVTYHEKYQSIYKHYKVKGKDGRLIRKKKVVGKKLVGFKLSSKLAKGTKEEMKRYFKAMGVKKTLVDLAFTTPHEKVYFMTMSDLRAFELATEIRELEELVQYRVCEGSKPPEYCVARE